MVASLQQTEISLFGTFYPIVGPVTLQIASQWPQKVQTIGDYTKDSEVIASSWVISDHRGGLGIKDMLEKKDANRFWWGTCNTDYISHLILGTLPTDCGAPGTGDIHSLIEYNNEQYVVQGVDVYKWTEASASWGASIRTLGASPTDVIVHKDKLYFACGLTYERFDGTNWVIGAKASRYMVEWDDRLCIMSNGGQLIQSTDEGATWTNNALLTLPAGSATSLFLYRNPAGTIVIHLGTKQGLYVLDFVASKWIPTELQLPKYRHAGKGAAVWRDAAYIPFGMGLYRYISSNPAVVTPVGLDRDYGVPSEYEGFITKLERGINSLFALIDTTEMVKVDLLNSGYLTDILMPDDRGVSWIAKWNEVGWRVLWISALDQYPITTSVVSSADNKYRLWIGQNRKVFYISLDVDLYNPLELAEFNFSPSGEHITGWFDADNAVINKLATRIVACAKDTSISKHIKIFYETDYTPGWTLMTNTAFPDGQIDTDGLAEFSFASGAGLVFKAIRFKIELARGAVITSSPDLRWLRLSYLKLLDVKWGYSMVADCARDYRGTRASELLAKLKTAAETQTLGDFAYRVDGTTATHKVRISNLQGQEVTGKSRGGLYSIQLVEP